MANVIFRGKGNPTTRNHPIDAALLPGSAVKVDYATGTFTTATAADADVLILTNLDFTGRSVEHPYEIGDTAAAYQIAKNDEFQLRAGGAITKGALVGIGAGGAFVAGAAGAFAVAESDAVAGELFDAKIINPTAGAAVLGAE